MRHRERYADRAKRDARARELKAQGFQVHRYCSHNQQLHPMYLKDCRERPEESFGNIAYKTTFAVVYTVTWTEKED